MMTSSNGNIFRVTGPLCWEFTGHLWIPVTKASDAELWCFLWKNGRTSSRGAGDFGRHHAHYDVTVMTPKNRQPANLSKIPTTVTCDGLNISKSFSFSMLQQCAEFTYSKRVITVWRYAYSVEKLQSEWWVWVWVKGRDGAVLMT